MPKMLNDAGQTFSCDEATAQAFERRGVARRLGESKSSLKREAKESEYATAMRFIRSRDASDFSHLAHAVVDMASAAGDRRAAVKIIDAGDIARAGGPAFPAPTGIAAAIIAAGKKARGEI